MRGLRALLVVVVLLGLLLVGADRVLALVAENKMADRLQQRLELTETPDVSINGFPLLTQAIAGTYREIEVSASGVDVEGYRDLDLDVRLQGVELPLSKAISGDIEGAIAQTAEATVRVPETSIAEAAGLDVRIEGAEGNAVTMSATVDVLGRSVDISVTATAQIEDGQVKLDVTEASAANVDLPSSAVSSISEALALQIPSPTLPAGMTLDNVSAEDGALVLTASGTDIPLTVTT